MVFTCEECLKPFPTPYKIKRHLKQFHKYDDAIIDQMIQPDYKIKCHVCQKTVETKVALIDHLNSTHAFQIIIENKDFDTELGNYLFTS